MSDDVTPAEREVRRLSKMYDETIDCYIEVLEKCNAYKAIIEELMLNATMSNELRSKVNVALTKLVKE